MYYTLMLQYYIDNVTFGSITFGSITFGSITFDSITFGNIIFCSINLYVVKVAVNVYILLIILTN